MGLNALRRARDTEYFDRSQPPCQTSRLSVTALVDLIESTVKLEQAQRGGLRTVGTGFIIADRRADGSPRTILITAHHVFDRMPNAQATLGLRVADPDGGWRYAPKQLQIRSADGTPLWTRHPVQDIAAIEIPAKVAGRAIPVDYLVGKDTLEDLEIQPGDELVVLGFPRGVAANKEGFPILRSGRVASYPISPASRFPTFLLDFSVFAGNSGGPVFVNRPRSVAASASPSPIIVGILTQQIKLEGDRLAIGNVTQAKYVQETVTLLGEDRAVVTATATPGSTGEIVPASEVSPPTRWSDRALAALSDVWDGLRRRMISAWIVLRDRIADLSSQPPVVRSAHPSPKNPPLQHER